MQHASRTRVVYVDDRVRTIGEGFVNEHLWAYGCLLCCRVRLRPFTRNSGDKISPHRKMYKRNDAAAHSTRTHTLSHMRRARER